MEFEEIRPYHDEELPQVFEELIADPAFQQVACAVMPGSYRAKDACKQDQAGVSGKSLLRHLA